MNRRTFLHHAAAAAAVSSFRLSANDGLNVLAIGVGNRGSADALNSARHGRVAAVCDVDSSQAGAFLAKLAKQQPGTPEVYKDYRRALEHKGIDAVTIGTPDHWHTAVLIAALRAGKDVYCEKPLTLTIDEGKTIARVVRETGRVVQVGTQQRSEFDRRFLKAVAIARSGRLGKKLTAICGIGPARDGGPFPTLDAPQTLDWDLWLGPAPATPYTKERSHSTFRWWFEYSGGKMTDWGAHHVDIAHWALGVENTGPVEIEGEGHLALGREMTLALLQGKKAEVPNVYNTATKFRITLRFANGNTIVVEEGEQNGIRIEGEDGHIWVSRKEITGQPVDEIVSSPKDAARLEEAIVKLYKGKQPSGQQGTHMANFVEAVRARSTPISDVATHHRAMTTCHLCNLAIILGRKLKWNPKAEDFIGDSEASALRSRRSRAPYGEAS